MNRLKNEYDGKIMFARYDIDAPASQEIANKYRVTGVPTFIALNAQQEEISRLSGGFPYSDLKKKLDRFVTE